MGSREGVIKVAAGRIGVSVAEWETRRADGQKWCTTCKEWHPVAEFDGDRTRGDGLKSACRKSSYRYVPVPLDRRRPHGPSSWRWSEMASESGIQWTTSTWNPLTGCKAVSPGCDNCYAAREASGRLKNVPAYEGLAVDGVFTGQIRMLNDRLDQPSRWRKGRRIFVNSMSDLFHHDVPVTFQEKVFEEMERNPQHQFQVLTKRPEIMARRVKFIYNGSTPSPHIWLGTTIEHNDYVRRADYLRATPATVRFISAEPLLGPLTDLDLTDIDWLICGGESGRDARRMSEWWCYELRALAAKSGTAFFMKQLGEALGKERSSRTRAGHDIESFPEVLQVREYPA